MSTIIPATMTAFFDTFLRVPAPGSRRLVPLVHFPAHDHLLAAYDLVGPDGLPVYSDIADDKIKKTGGSLRLGGVALGELVGAGPAHSEPDREIIQVSSSLEQSKNIAFASAARFARRHPWLEKRVRVLQTEIIYKQIITNQRTGGRHTETHVIRAVPAKQAESLHGVNPTLVEIDEAWSFTTYDQLEALAPSPARRISRRWFCSYAGLRSMMKEGNPWWDLLQRHKAGGDPRLYVEHQGGPDAWRAVPFLSERTIEVAKRAFITVPSKFRRMYQNEWVAGDEQAFLTTDEIQAAQDPALSVEPQRSEGCAMGRRSRAPQRLPRCRRRQGDRRAAHSAGDPGVARLSLQARRSRRRRGRDRRSRAAARRHQDQE